MVWFDKEEVVHSSFRHLTKTTQTGLWMWALVSSVITEHFVYSLYPRTTSVNPPPLIIAALHSLIITLSLNIFQQAVTFPTKLLCCLVVYTHDSHPLLIRTKQKFFFQWKGEEYIRQKKQLGEPGHNFIKSTKMTQRLKVFKFDLLKFIFYETGLKYLGWKVWNRSDSYGI